MTDQLLDSPAVAAAGALRAGVDELLGLQLDQLSPVELARLLGEVETSRRRLEAVDQRLLAHPTTREAAFETCAGTVSDLLVTGQRVSRYEARARIRRAESLGPRRMLTGEPLPPLHPLTARAVEDGEISAAQVDIIVSALQALPPTLSPEVVAVAEGVLVESARHEDPAGVRRTAESLDARLDPDGLEPREDRAERSRSFSISGHRAHNGTVDVRGSLTAEAAALLRAVLDPLAAPRPAADGEPDPRTTGQRYHDAVTEACERLLRSGTLPESGGVSAAVIVHLHAHSPGDPIDGPGTGTIAPVAQLGGGDLVPLTRLGALLDTAEVTTVRLSPGGGVLSYGRALRCATAAQRRVLAGRDGGCCFPGCTRPPGWCQAHHVLAWLDGGLTDIDNLVLACSYHHRNFERAGWTLRMLDGVPHWIPPPCVDPEGTPVRNTAHHLDPIDVRIPEPNG